MNKAMRQSLEAVVNSIVNEDTAAGTKAFHDFIRAKSQQILLGEKHNDEDKDEDDDDDDDDDEEDEDDEDDKPAFLKKKSKKKADKSDKNKE
jgi:hypothetical protein